MGDENFAVVCCRLNLPKSPSDRLTELYRESTAALRRGGKPFLFLSRASEQLDRSWFEFFNELNVPLLLEYEKSLCAVRDVLNLSQRSPSADRAVPPVPAQAAAPSTTAAEVAAPATAPTEAAAPGTAPEETALRADSAEIDAMQRLLAGGDASYATVRRLLRAYGIPASPGQLVRSREEAVEASGAIGFPVALKVESPDLPHKTEAGGVRLDLASADEVAQSYDRLLEEVGKKAPDARIDGVLAQKMVQGVAEVIIGTSRTPDLGICLVFGLGGIYTRC